MSKSDEVLSNLARIRKGVQNVMLTEIPARGECPAAEVAFVVVPGGARTLATSRAVARLKKLGIDPTMQAFTHYEDEWQWELLWDVMRDPAHLPRHFARDSDEVRELLTIEERDMLLSRYYDFEEEVAPSLPELSEEAARGIANALKKKDLRGLIAYGSIALASYLLTTASQQQNSPTHNSGSGGSRGSVQEALENSRRGMA